MAKGKKPARTPWADARAKQFEQVETPEQGGRDWKKYHETVRAAMTNPTRENLLNMVKVCGSVYVNGNHQIRSSVFRTLLNRGEVKMIREASRRSFHVYPDGSRKKVIRGNGQSFIVLAETS